MIDQESLQAVADARWGAQAQFVRPRYDHFGFALIPQAIRRAFGIAGRSISPFGRSAPFAAEYDTVILCFIDSFGWRFFERYAEHAFLKRFVADGVACKITTQFPSTTAAHVTAIHTGLEVGQSGVYEWYCYDPTVGAVIAPLLFSFAGDTDRETLARTRVVPTAIYPNHTFYEELRRNGVQPFVFQSRAYARSSYSSVVTRGATMLPYTTFPEALILLGQQLQQRRGPSYYMLYLDTIDTICHHYGPESAHLSAEIEAFLDLMERQFQRILAHGRGRTLVLMTADHGQTAVDPERTIYLNQRLPELTAMMQLDSHSRPIVPAGSCRDMFLHIKPDMLDAAEDELWRMLDGRAEVHRVADLIAQGFFGREPPADTLLRRIGNLVLLPYIGEAVWWYERGRFEQRFYGMHGGLSADEMESILLALPYGL
ncbi:MAG TPA: alkaline phosphatase family protein [Roseiflexaceae bacterium]|nr:alkaline phosphatase family protein [Roseiflexaceae bacterium]HMP39075.1 alkaline phosphatase family protein [Roseiflexaceae bacterium]